MYYGSETKVTSLTRIRRERVLPQPGEVLVSAGDRVESTQVVARASQPSGFRIVPVARLLDVSASEVESSLEVDLGDQVHRGDVIAKKGGLIGRSVKSPIGGIVIARGGGRVLIEAQPTPFELHAYVSGVIAEVRDDQRVVVEAIGALIQGNWGSREESVGVLKRIAETADAPLEADVIDPSCHGSILIAGRTKNQEALERTRDIEASGIVSGSLSPELIPFVDQLPFPIIVTEGIGDVPMSSPIFDLLCDHEGEEASVSGRTDLRWGTERPEVIIPRTDRNALPYHEAEHEGLNVGAQVRIVRRPYLGCVGTVIGIPRYSRRIETDARVRCAEVDIGQGEPIAIPLVNLDVLR